MKTLSKKITLTILKDQEAYQRLITDWSNVMRAKTELSAEYHLTYLVLRGKDWRRGFKDLEGVKITDGGVRALKKILNYLKCHQLHYCVSQDILKPEAIEILQGLLTDAGEESYKEIKEVPANG